MPTPHPIRRPPPLCAAPLISLLALALACDRLEAPLAAPILPAPEPLIQGPLPLERPPMTPEQQALAEQKAFESKLAPQVLEALRDLDWGFLKETFDLPPLRHELPPNCPIDYVQNSSVRMANDRGGLFKVVSSNLFTLENVMDATSKAKREGLAQYTSRMIAFFLEHPDKKTALWVFGGKDFSTKKFRFEDRKRFFRGATSPIFFAALNQSPIKGKNTRLLDQNILLDFFPELPDLPDIGAETRWDYNLVFDKADTLVSRPHGWVRLESWLRVRDQRVAYVTVVWPKDEEVWVAEPNLPVFSLRNRKSATTYLQQKNKNEGHFLISENGTVLFAYFEGEALETTESLIDPNESATRKTKGASRASPKDWLTFIDREEVFFSFWIKALSDCNGSFLKKVTPEKLSADGIKKLADEFISLFTIGRKKEALRRLSPEIRYAFTDEFVSQMLTRQFEVGGMNSFGKPTVVEGGDEDLEEGLAFEGFNSFLKTKTYSSFRGEIRDGIPVLTFIGTSSSSDKRRWDILELSRNNFVTQVRPEKPERSGR
ncbi:MAG: hypothetical protein LBM75_11250 [Myxococcales bacterium]|jgi:hypothetical protein|nr:hypothetical protein [Myxococcales bacterium]